VASEETEPLAQGGEQGSTAGGGSVPAAETHGQQDPQQMLVRRRWRRENAGVTYANGRRGR